MWKFLKEKFFFRINNDDREHMRKTVMERDHKILSIVIISIIVAEFLMLLLSLLNIDPSSSETIENAYRLLYLFLIFVSGICLLFMNVFYKKKKYFQYFIFVAIFNFAVMMWGASISTLVSLDSFSFLYFALALIACSAFICLEPWINTLSVLISTIFYIVLYLTIDGIEKTSSTIFFGGIALLDVIVLAAFYVNFYRRIAAINLQIKISKLNKTLETKSFIDDLTQVYNRRFLTQNIDNELIYGERSSGILMIDLDHFKIMNDTHGHQVGDLCLAELGTILSESINDETSYCVRYGGEEFLIFFKETTESEIMNFAEKLRKTIEKNTVNIPGGASVKFTISIGVSLAHDDMSYNSLIHDADEALYKAKLKRNNVCLYKSVIEN